MQDEVYEFELKGTRLKCYVQSGNLVRDWIQSPDGTTVLIACDCGQAVFGSDIDDAFRHLRDSIYIIKAGHLHYSGSTVACNIITAYSEDNFVAGRISAPELLPRIQVVMEDQ